MCVFLAKPVTNISPQSSYMIKLEIKYDFTHLEKLVIMVEAQFSGRTKALLEKDPRFKPYHFYLKRSSEAGWGWGVGVGKGFLSNRC